ncbi:MAG: flagellar hook-associated protein FlgK [Opitutales bacterium]|nr:flagellar hook-associated protein FlgK [Opitutales bacterium]
MAGLMGDLINSSQALANHSSSLSTIGRNLSNVNNANYARQSVEKESYAGPGGAYYTLSQTTSARDAILDRQVTNEVSDTGAAKAEYDLYYQLNNVMSESLNGSLGASLETAEAAGTGITGGLSSFFNSWSALAASPNSYGAQSNVYTSAEELATRLNDASKSIDQVEETLNASLDDDVSEANALLEKIATLNSNIVRMEARQVGSANTLKDERQAAMEDLSSLIDFSSTSESDGSISISTNGDPAQTLVSGGVAGSIGIAVDAATGQRTGLTTTFNGTTSAFAPESGSLSVLNPSNTSAVLTEMREQLDALASQLISSVNAVYQLSGQGDFFSGTGAADIAVAVADAASIKANYDDGDAVITEDEAEGSNAVADAISKLSTQSFDGATDAFDGTFSTYAASIATDVAAEYSSATSALETQEEMELLVRENRDNITGVSTEEEMTSLLRTQSAYQASARVMSIVNTLLDLVTTRLGA